MIDFKGRDAQFDNDPPEWWEHLAQNPSWGDHLEPRWKDRLELSGPRDHRLSDPRRPWQRANGYCFSATYPKTILIEDERTLKAETASHQSFGVVGRLASARPNTPAAT